MPEEAHGGFSPVASKLEIIVSESEDDLKEPKREKSEQYWRCLGRFVATYAEVEDILNGALYTISAVDPRVGKSVFSGTRIRTAISFINRILDATEQNALKDELKPLFDQLSLVSSMRDNLLHSSVQFDRVTKEFVWDGIKSAHVESRRQVFAVTPAMLTDMTVDTGQIGLRLTYLLANGTMPAEALSWFQSRITSTWRYKPPPPTAPPEVFSNSSQLQPLQPHAKTEVPDQCSLEDDP